MEKITSMINKRMAVLGLKAISRRYGVRNRIKSIQHQETLVESLLMLIIPGLLIQMKLGIAISRSVST